jgi:hypothetical protein
MSLSSNGQSQRGSSHRGELHPGEARGSSTSEVEGGTAGGTAETAECPRCERKLVGSSCPSCGQKADPPDPTGSVAKAAGAARDLFKSLTDTGSESPPVGMILFVLNLVTLVVVIALSLIFPGLFF